MSIPSLPLSESAAPNRFASAVQSAVPGLLLTVIVAMAAFAVRTLPGFGFLSPMILAILIGAALRNAGAVPVNATPGIRVALRRVLRIGIVLLGLQLTAEQVAEVGAGGIAVIVATVIATFAVTLTLGRWLGVDRKLAELVAAGTSICGASAVIAANTVTRAPDEDAAYAVACVTVFGSLSMVLYPMLLPVLHLSAHAYGLWTGASIHEIAQVVAAAFQGGQDAGSFGTIAKLSRVMLLAPLVLAMSWQAARRAPAGETRTGSVPVPWFVIGFVAVVALNSVVDIGAAAKSWIVPLTTFLLTVALAAMGLETDVAKLRARGARPLLLGAASWLFISGASLVLVRLL